MPVLPSFQPAEAPGQLIPQAMSVAGQQQSLMDRADQQRIRDAQEARAKQTYELLKPLAVANAKTQMLSAQVQLDHLHQMEQSQQQALIMLPQARKDFSDLMSVKDADLRAELAQHWMADYSQLAGIKDIAPEWDQKLHLATGMVTDNLKLKALAVANDRAIQVARIGAGAKENVAQTQAGARTEAAQTYAGSRTDVAQINAGARTEAATITAEAKATAEKKRVYETEKTKALYDQAVEDGDQTGIVVFGGRLKKMNAIAGEPVAELPTPQAAKKPAASQAQSDGKLYVLDPATKAPTIAPTVKSPQDVLKAVQQMVDDGVIDAATARETLTKLGFKKK